jgi:hypothetical protein
VKLERQDLQELLVHKVSKDPRAIPVIPEKLARQDRLEKLVRRVTKAIKETPEKLVQLVQQVQLARPVHKVLRVRKVLKVYQPRDRSAHFYSSKLGKPHGTKEKQANGNI